MFEKFHLTINSCWEDIKLLVDFSKQCFLLNIYFLMYSFSHGKNLITRKHHCEDVKEKNAFIIGLKKSQLGWNDIIIAIYTFLFVFGQICFHLNLSDKKRSNLMNEVFRYGHSKNYW